MTFQVFIIYLFTLCLDVEGEGRKQKDTRKSL